MFRELINLSQRVVTRNKKLLTRRFGRWGKLRWVHRSLPQRPKRSDYSTSAMM